MILRKKGGVVANPVWQKWSKLVAGANVNMYVGVQKFFKLPSAEGVR